MSQKDCIFASSEDNETISDMATNHISQKTADQKIICPSCGARREKFSDTCTECGVVFVPRARGVAMVPCPMCDGTGTIFLKYLADYALAEGNQEEHLLPCADCDGTGEIPRRVIIERQNKQFRRQLLAIILELLDGLSRR